VIGGVVDRVRKPGASLQRAEEAGLRAVRLPTAGVFDTPNKPDALSCLGCVQAMLAFHGGTRPSWGEAFVAAPAMWCAPLRKYVVWRGEYAHLNKPAARKGRPQNITG
jgi:tRNA (guanine9-N1)-methyltransferase